MKKLFLLVLALIMLCSCGVQEEPVTEEPQSEAEVSVPEKVETKEIETVDSVSYLGENGKYGFHNNGVPVTEPIFDAIIPIKRISDEEIYIDSTDEEANGIYAGTVTDGTRKTLDGFSWEGTNVIERENILYSLYEKGSDSLINEIPLFNFNYFGLEGYGNVLGKFMIKGTNGGDLYEFVREEDGWKLYEMQSGGVYNAYSEVCYMTRYHWTFHKCYYGLEKPDGTVIIEPVFGNLEMLPYDFVLAYDGYSRVTIDDLICTYIFDYEGNVICDEYAYVGYEFVGNMKYVMTAMLRDETGDDHWYFIDQSGNKLSESYNKIELVFDNEGTAEKAKVTADTKTYNGDAPFEEIPIENYIIRKTF